MLHLPTELLDRFQQLIYSQSSLKFSAHRLTNLENQLRERARVRGLSSFDDYFEVLKNDTQEFEALIEGITTKETYFFRLPDQFQVLKQELLPGLEERLSQETHRQMAEGGGPGPMKVPLRIWSAGCATGEETYSIAMTVLDGLQYPRAWQLEILASDISHEAVRAASIGYYSPDVLKRIPPDYQKKYLSVLPTGVMIASAIIDKICFRVFNLHNLVVQGAGSCAFYRTDGSGEFVDLSQRFHIIFCRNVMIYFDLEAQQRLVDGLYNCLRPGGCLFTGDAELLHIYQHRFQTRQRNGTYYYQRPEVEKSIPGDQSQ